MKRQTPAGQKAIAAAVLLLTGLSAAYCLREPSAEAIPKPPVSSADVHLPAHAPSTPDPAEELEEHGYYQDPLVNQGPLPNRQVPRRSYSGTKDTRETDERQYSRQAADEVVETILSSIITPEMSAAQKCNEVYYYVKGCISYKGSSVRSSWSEAAYWGFTTGRGDEYTFYACSRALLTALGYQVRQVQRQGGDMEEPHSWCLVNYGEGWYHFDPCPHLKSDPLFVCCLSSDQQLMDFDAGAQRDYYAFDPDAYPERVGGRADPANTVPIPRQTPEASGSTPTPPPVGSQPPADPDASSEPTPSEGRESPPPADVSPSAPLTTQKPPPASQSPVSSAPAVPEDTTPPAPSAPEPTPPLASTPIPEEPLLPPGV